MLSCYIYYWNNSNYLVLVICCGNSRNLCQILCVVLLQQKVELWRLFINFFFKDDVLVICFGMNVTSLLFYKHLVFCVMPDEAIGGNGEDKTLLGLLDVSKGNCMAF